MKNLSVKRLDHHGTVAGIIDDLGIVEIIDQHIEKDEQELISAGIAIKGMILNALGFTNRPLTLTPQFFENLPMEHLFGKDIKPEYFNRHKLGRTLDQIFKNGSTTLFSKLAHNAITIEAVNTKTQSLDTTSLSVTGKYNIEINGSLEPQPITITHGYSKDHRPNQKQLILELIVSQDSGIPLFMKVHNGNASDTVVFKERVKTLVQGLQDAEDIGVLVADSKMYTKDAVEWLKQISFITRIPSTISLEQKCIKDALLASEKWIEHNNGYQSQRFEVLHNDLKQDWFVFSSKETSKRAKKQVDKKFLQENQTVKKQIFHLQVKEFS